MLLNYRILPKIFGSGGQNDFVSMKSMIFNHKCNIAVFIVQIQGSDMFRQKMNMLHLKKNPSIQRVICKKYWICVLTSPIFGTTVLKGCWLDILSALFPN